MDKRFTEGICGDGAAILDNGVQITVRELLNNLNKLDELEQLNLCAVGNSGLNDGFKIATTDELMIGIGKGQDEANIIHNDLEKIANDSDND